MAASWNSAANAEGRARPRPRRSGARLGGFAAAALSLSVGVAGCFGPSRRAYVSTPGPYDRLGPEAALILRGARAAREAGDLSAASQRLEELLAEEPYKIVAAVELQDIELERLVAGEALHELGGDATRAPRERLRVVYAERAERDPTPASLVLAARLETDGPSALRLLDQALELDPACLWAHYGRAHSLFQQGNFSTALEAVQSALDLDSGHLPARRLEVRTLVEAGEPGSAAAALREWIDDARDSPQVSVAELFGARVDLAILYALDGRESDALDLLDDLVRENPGGARALVARSATHFALGHWPDSLRDAQAALVLTPDDPMPALQRARVVESIDDSDEAAAAWAQVLEILDRLPPDPNGGMAQLIVRIQARVRLQRLEREATRELARLRRVEPRREE